MLDALYPDNPPIGLLVIVASVFHDIPSIGPKSHIGLIGPICPIGHIGLTCPIGPIGPIGCCSY